MLQKDSENVLSRKLKETEEQLRLADARNGDMSSTIHQAEQDLANLRNKMSTLEGSQNQNVDVVRNMEAKLKEADIMKQQMEAQVTDLAGKNQEKDKDLQVNKIITCIYCGY